MEKFILIVKANNSVSELVLHANFC